MSGLFSPTAHVRPFADWLFAQDLPGLDAERRGDTVEFVARRVDVLPTPMALGVGAIALAARGLLAVPGGRVLLGFLARRPLPLVGEYVRLVRSLGYAYVWGRVARLPVGRVAPGMTTGVTGSGPTLDADVLVIGSGAGGAVTAALLAEAGVDVLVAEEGPWVEQGTVTPFSLEQMDRQYRSGGVTVALGRPSIAYTEGRCAGGGTEINSGLYRRPPAELLERWRADLDIEDFDTGALAAISCEIEQALNVSTAPGPPVAAGDVLRRGADALGWENSEIPRWMTYPAPGSAEGGQRQSMTRTYLPRATAAGARLVTGCRVDRLATRNGRAHAALVTGAGGQPGTIRFRDVIVCGGAIQTPAILQRSGIHGVIGTTLAVHPTVKLAARFRDAVNVPDDVPVHQVKEFAPDLSFGCSASGPGLVALALSDNWVDFARAVPEWRNIAVYYAAITSEGRGRVRALPRLADPLVTYRLTGRDCALLRSGLARLALVMLEAGAVEVYPSVRGAPLVRNRRDLAELQRTFRASKASVMTVHLCSTVPMGERRDRCGAGSHGLVHGTGNVYVNDASLLPDAPGVNPQGTVMSFAVRNARAYLAGRPAHA